MLNNNNMMLSKGTGQEVELAPGDGGPVQISGYTNGAAMLQRADREQDIPPAPAGQAAPTAEEKDIYNAAYDAAQEQTQPAVSKPAAQPVAVSKQQAPAQPRKQAAQPASKPAQPAAPSGAIVTRPVRSRSSPDALCQAYIKFFKDSLGLDLSTAICFENMRRMCEVNVKDPAKTLYFLENTYRVSTLTYLARNLPIIFIASVLAEKNRKNILKYVTIEVENGSKPYDDLLELRKKRWARKFENMAVNDAMTVTPGATSLSPELSQRLSDMLREISAKLRPFNAEMDDIVAKFDDSALNDITYIFSNWWYLLQGFENVQEMRTYIMSITDDTRRNLRI